MVSETAEGRSRWPVFFLCEGAAPTAELLAIAQELCLRDGYAPVLGIVDEEARSVVGNGPEGAELVDVGDHPRGKTRNLGRPSGTKRTWRHRLASTAVGEILLTAKFLGRLRESAERLLSLVDPIAVLVTSDRGSGTQMAFISASRRRDAPSLVIPFASSDPNADARLRRGSDTHLVGRKPHRLLKTLTSKLWPNQLRDTPYGRMVFASAPTTVALALTDLLPSLPWVAGGGSGTRVAVLSEGDRRRLLDEGVPSERVVVTGQPTLDEMYRAAQQRSSLRAGFVKKDAMDPERKIICCAVPQLFEHRMLDEEAHLAETSWLFEMLSRMPAEVVLSLHPKSDRSAYSLLAGHRGLTILDDPLRRVLPVVDVFLASRSSTVRWAAALEIPTVVMDQFKLAYPSYEGMPGISVAEDRHGIEAALVTALQAERTQHHEGGRDSLALDGRAIERVISVIDGWRSTAG